MVDRLTLEGSLVDLLRAALPDVAEHTVTAVREEVPAYNVGLGEQMAATIEQAVQMALAGFLRVAGRAGDPGKPLSPPSRAPTRWAAAKRGPAARPTRCWRPTGSAPASRGASSRPPRSRPASRRHRRLFAELVFAYIDELSAASVAGHTDELETTGRVRQRYLDRLAVGLLRGEPADAVTEAAERADWTPPKTLTAVLLPESQVRPVLGLVTPGSADPERARPPRGARRGARARHGRPVADPAAEDPRRPSRRGRPGPAVAGGAVVVRARGPRPRPAPYAGAARHRAPPGLAGGDRRPRGAGRPAGRALAPLADVRPATAEKLEATLRSWLLHQGRREDVAADLFVHPQTVRYRMNQLRELYGDALEDPQTVLMLTLALA